jgi:hypothetical protein
MQRRGASRKLFQGRVQAGDLSMTDARSMARETKEVSELAVQPS